jgi:hypothetical protein
VSPEGQGGDPLAFLALNVALVAGIFAALAIFHDLIPAELPARLPRRPPLSDAQTGEASAILGPTT